MKFKLDEILGETGRDVLTVDGHDVMTVAEQALSGAADQRIYEVCKDEARVLITLDHDFGEVLRFQPSAMAGIIVLELRGRLSPRAIRERMAELAAFLRTRPIDRELWIVEPGRVRIHQSDEG